MDSRNAGSLIPRSLTRWGYPEQYGEGGFISGCLATANGTAHSLGLLAITKEGSTPPTQSDDNSLHPRESAMPFYRFLLKMPELVADAPRH